MKNQLEFEWKVLNGESQSDKEKGGEGVRE